MSTIGAPVGARGVNRPVDVKVVQKLLNVRVGDFAMRPLGLTGVCDEETIRALRNFQILALRDSRASGTVELGDRTWAALIATDPGSRLLQEGRTKLARRMLSGAHWFGLHAARFQDSRRLADLAPGFQAAATAFVTALERAGAEVMVLTTRRDPIRAWLMDHSFRIAQGSLLPEHVVDLPEAGIIWNHGDRRRSQVAAREMADAFRMQAEPAADSPHLEGLAIDMTIGWSQPIQMLDAAGKPHILDRPRSGATNEALHAIGAGFGVRKRLADPLVWSLDGR